MSSYVDFWLKNKDGAVTHILSYSRNNHIYKAIYEAGMTGIRTLRSGGDSHFDFDIYAQPFSRKDSQTVREAIGADILLYKDYIKDYEKRIEFIKSVSDVSLDEKIKKYDQELEAIAETKDEIEDMERALNLLVTLEIIRETIGYSFPYEQRDLVDGVIYVGIDSVMES